MTPAGVLSVLSGKSEESGSREVAALDYLHEHGYVRPEEKPRRGETTLRWLVNPAACDLDTPDNPAPRVSVVDVVNVAEEGR